MSHREVEIPDIDFEGKRCEAIGLSVGICGGKYCFSDEDLRCEVKTAIKYCANHDPTFNLFCLFLNDGTVLWWKWNIALRRYDFWKIERENA